MKSTFYNKQLEIGRYYENRAKELIKNTYNVEIVEEQTDDNYKYVYYDFKTSDGSTYEIKADLLSNKTNSFFIEFKNNKCDTGITTTAAKYHIITNSKEYYLIKTKKIKQLIFFNGYTVKCTKDGTHGYIVPCDDIRNISKILGKQI